MESLLQYIDVNTKVIRFYVDPYSRQAFHDMHFTTCTSRHALHDMHFTVCTSGHALTFMHFTACTSRHALQGLIAADNEMIF